LPAPILNGGGDRPGKVQFLELQKQVKLTLTLVRVIWHTAVHQSSTFIYIPNFIEIGKTYCVGMDVRTSDVPTDGHFRPPLMLLGRLGGVDLEMSTTLWVKK